MCTNRFKENSLVLLERFNPAFFQLEEEEREGGREGGRKTREEERLRKGKDEGKKREGIVALSCDLATSMYMYRDRVKNLLLQWKPNRSTHCCLP